MNNLLANYEQYENTWDEMFDDSGKVRTIYSHFGKFLSEAKLDSLNQMKEFSNQFFKNQGVTFTVYHDNKGVERIFPFDIPVANPKVVLAAAASASSIKEAPNVLIVLVSTLSELRFVKFASTSLLVRGEPLPDLVTIVAMIYPFPINLLTMLLSKSQTLYHQRLY